MAGNFYGGGKSVHQSTEKVLLRRWYQSKQLENGSRTFRLAYRKVNMCIIQAVSEQCCPCSFVIMCPFQNDLCNIMKCTIEIDKIRGVLLKSLVTDLLLLPSTQNHKLPPE